MTHACKHYTWPPHRIVIYSCYAGSSHRASSGAAVSHSLTVIASSIDHVLQVVWLPGQDMWLAIVTGGAVHLYCLSHSAVQAMLTLTAPQGGLLAGATFCTVQSSSEVRESWIAAGDLSWEQPSRPLRLAGVKRAHRWKSVAASMIAVQARSSPELQCCMVSVLCVMRKMECQCDQSVPCFSGSSVDHVPRHA